MKEMLEKNNILLKVNIKNCRILQLKLNLKEAIKLEIAIF